MTTKFHEMCPEMLKLRDMLDEMNIDWEDDSDSPGEYMIYRTHFYYNEDAYSVIYEYGTYGGWNRFPEKEDPQLLELMINNDEATGGYTAEDIINIMKADVAEYVTYTDAQLDCIQQVINNVNTTAKGIEFAADKFSTKNMIAEYIKQNHETLCGAFEAKCGVNPDNIWYDEAENAIKASKTATDVVETIMVDVIINPKGQTDI